MNRPERAGREGDQALPQASARSADVFEDVIAVLRSRQSIGVRRYGLSLHTFNGRDAARDEVEEFIDGFIYRHQQRMERAALEAELARVTAERDAQAAAREQLEQELQRVRRSA
jgi:hypothetical protein